MDRRPRAFAALPGFLPLAVILPLILPPLIALSGDAALSESGLPWPDARQWTIFFRSAAIAAGAAGLSVLLGYGLSLLLLHAGAGPRPALLWGLLIPAALPPFLHGLVWTQLLSAHGFLHDLGAWIGVPRGGVGCALLAALAYHPLVLFLLWGGLHSISGEILESGRMTIPASRVPTKLVMPLTLPYGLAGFCLVFVLVFTDYGLPSLLGVNTFPIEIFIAYSAELKPAGVLRGLWPMILLSLFVLGLHFKFMGGRAYGGTREGAADWSIRPKRPAVGLVLGWLVLAVGLPILQLVWNAFTGSGLIAMLAASARSLAWSAGLAAAAASLCLAAALSLVGRGHPNGSGWGRRAAQWPLLLSLGIPGTALGIGVLKVFNRGVLRPMLDSPLILVFGWFILYLPYALLILRTARRQVPRELYDAAACSSASRFRTMLQIFIPLLRPGLGPAFLIPLLLGLRELGYAALVMPPGVETLPVRLDSFLHYQAAERVAGLALMLVLFCMGVFFFMVRPWRPRHA